MKLKKLLQNISNTQVYGNKDIKIHGVCSDSRRIAPGDLFIAKKGLQHNGSEYIFQAIQGGACAVLCDLYDPLLKGLVQVIHPNVDEIEGEIASQFFDHAAKKLKVIGVTGTNGKTSTSYIIRHLMEAMTVKTGLLGTIEYIVDNDHHYPANLTTPDVLTLHRLLNDMLRHDCKACVMEASSHALKQDRLQLVEFDVAVYTNLSQDHLDYHSDMESYAQAKSLLFSKIKEGGTAVVNLDCPWHQEVLSKCKEKQLTYSIASKNADLIAKNIRFSSEGTYFTVLYRDQSLDVQTPLMGKFNVYNTLAAIGAGIASGYDLSDLIQALPSFQGVSGRLEKVSNQLGIQIFVDYAHTPDALLKTLQALNKIKTNRVISLVGCGGERDQEKRPLMGSIAQQNSDITIFTSDNPRSEDPEYIIKAMLSSTDCTIDNIIIEVERERAIHKAISLAKEGDIVLIAGKGHEKYQSFARKTIPFDDKEIASEFCKAQLSFSSQ